MKTLNKNFRNILILSPFLILQTVKAANLCPHFVDVQHDEGKDEGERDKDLKILISLLLKIKVTKEDKAAGLKQLCN